MAILGSGLGKNKWVKGGVHPGSRMVVVLDHEEGGGEPVDILWKIGIRIGAICVGKIL